MNNLKFKKSLRTVTSNQTSICSVDFIIDNVPLSKILKTDQDDLVGVFTQERIELNKNFYEEYLLNKKSDLRKNRILVFACGECGDISCGGITMKISLDNDRIIWSDFAYENNYDESASDFESYQVIGPFIFNFQEYKNILNKAYHCFQ